MVERAEPSLRQLLSRRLKQKCFDPNGGLIPLPTYIWTAPRIIHIGAGNNPLHIRRTSRSPNCRLFPFLPYSPYSQPIPRAVEETAVVKVASRHENRRISGLSGAANRALCPVLHGKIDSSPRFLRKRVVYPGIIGISVCKSCSAFGINAD